MKWLEKKHDEILRKWKANEITYTDAIAALYDLGYGVNYSAKLLAKT